MVICIYICVQYMVGIGLIRQNLFSRQRYDAEKPNDISAAASDFIGPVVLCRDRSTPMFRLSRPLAHGFAVPNY